VPLVVGLLLARTVASSTVAGAQEQTLGARIREYARKHDFNGTILVEQKQRTTYHAGFGVADRAFAVPIGLDTKFKIASITKAFTAVLILQLYEQGKIDLHAPIRRYLPDYAGEGADRVTLHNLLNHTSGIENFDQIKSYEEAATKGMEVYQLPHSTADLLSKYSSGKLVHEVGKEFDYNNGDYIILGKIIESITGKTYEETLQHQILDPLRMTASGLLYQQQIVRQLAPTYLKVDDAKPLINDLPVYSQNWYAAGAMYSTTRDLLKFSHALFGARLLKSETLNMMLTPGLDGYGYGLWIPRVEIRGKQRRVAHRPGRIMGANVALLRYMDDEVTIIILSNTNATDIDAFAFFIGTAVVR
jgi:CubicO group peptidase (beta-lactamase class C family)